MQHTCESIDKTRTLIEQTIQWADSLRRVPVVYLQEDRTSFMARPSRVLEIAYHASGGEVQIELGPLRHRSIPGTILVMNTCMGYQAVPESPASVWNASFDISAGGPAEGLSDTPLLSAGWAPVSTRAIERYRVAAHGHRQRRLLQHTQLKCEVLEVLIALLEALAQKDQSPCPRSAATAAAIRLMERAFDRPGLRRSHLAAVAHLSEAHFARVFRQEVGTTPMGYLNRLRIARACELLDRTDLNVGEVGRAVGLPAPSHFSRVFKALQGVSPRAYRDQSAGSQG